MRPLRLSRLLFIRSLLAAVVTFVIIYLLVVLWLMPHAEREVEHRQILLGRAIVEQVHTHLAGPAFMLEGMARALGGRRNIDPQQIYAMFDSFLEQSGSFSSLYLIGDDGLVIAAGLPPERHGMRPDLLGLDLSAHPLWRAAHESDGLIWTDAFLSTVGGGFAVAAARRSGSHTLIGELAFDALLDRLIASEPGEHGLRVLLLDRRGRTLADSQGELRDRQQDFGQNDFIRNPSHYAGRVVSFDFESVPMVAIVASVPQLDWRVLVMRPQAEAYRPVRIATVILVGGLIAAVFVALLSAAAQARYFSLQFGRLSDFAGAVGEGRYDLGWNPSRVTELNELAASFGCMSEAIRAREQELADSQLAYRELVESTTELVVRLDADRRLTYVNPAVCRLLGVEEAGLTGQPVERWLYYGDESRLHALFSELSAGADSVQFECPVRNCAGETCRVAWTLHAGRDENGVCSYGAIGRDITDRWKADEELRRSEERLRELNETLEARVAARTADLHRSNQELGTALDELQRAQEELLRAEKMAALGALVAGVAHELGTPLGNSLMAANTLTDHTRALRRELESGLRRSTLDQYMTDAELGTRIIERNLTRASQLVTSFRQVAVDQSSSQRREFLLGEVVEEIALTLRPSFKRQPWTLETEVEPGLRLDSYPGPLGQVIANLVNNAIVHAFAGRAEGKVRVSGQADGGEAVLIEVRDDGNGIPAEMQRRIFDPFFTTRMGQGGSGLGLHIAQNLVTNLLGGSIAVDSQPGTGTCMRVRIPRHAPQPREGGEADRPRTML